MINVNVDTSWCVSSFGKGIHGSLANVNMSKLSLINSKDDNKFLIIGNNNGSHKVFKFSL